MAIIQYSPKRALPPDGSGISFFGYVCSIEPIKPFVNAEPSYEDIPVLFWEYFDYAKFGKKKEDIIGDNGLIKDTTYFTDGIYDDYDIRMQAYWTYFSGAAISMYSYVRLT